MIEAFFSGNVKGASKNSLNTFPVNLLQLNRFGKKKKKKVSKLTQLYCMSCTLQ